MKPSQIHDLLCTLIPAKEPVLLVGPPGVGKTDSVKKVAKTLGWDLLITHPVVDDPTDYKGMPAVVPGVNGGESIAQFLPFGDLRRMRDATAPLLVFMDDLGQAPPAVQAAIMQLVLARKINGHPVSDHVVFIAATNRPKDKAAVTGMISPLLDRFSLAVDIEFNLDDWVVWGVANAMPAVLLAFARFRGDLWAQFEPSKDLKKSATPRSIAGLGRLLNLGLDANDVVAGAVGEGFAAEFTAFHRTWKELPDPDSIFKAPDKAPVPDKPDVLYALMGALANRVNEEKFGAMARYLARLQGPEYAVVCMKDTLLRNPDIKKLPEFREWAIANKQIFGYAA